MVGWQQSQTWKLLKVVLQNTFYLVPNFENRYAHQVILCALEILLKRAYNKEAMTQPFEEWKRNKESKHPQFKSWSSKCDMEMLLLHFVRSLRSKNVTLFVESLEEMLPFCFVLDHLNYARSNYELSSVLLKDLKSLSSTNPTIYISFLEGDFVVTKTFRNFSSIPIDHAHEKKKQAGERGWWHYWVDRKHSSVNMLDGLWARNSYNSQRVRREHA